MIRRDFLKAGGALVVGFSLRDTLVAQEQVVRGTKAGPPDAQQVDTWLAIHADNTATVYIGFAELGQGASTALLQIAAEELDLDMSQIKTVRLDTNVTPNQGGTYSSASINRGGPQVRTAAAEARLALLKLASAKLNTPQDQLTVSKGVVSGSGIRSVTYGELVGDKPFNVTFTGNAPVKPTTEYKIVGTKFPRNDTPAKVSAQYTYMQYVRVPGMLHGRVVRPRGQRMYGAGAKIVSVDEASIRAIPGARVVRKGDFLGVVAENEWDAIRAAQQLKVVWETPPALPGNAGLYEHMRAAKTEDISSRARQRDHGIQRGRAHRFADVPGSLPGARALRAELCGGRCEGRFRAGDVLHAGRLWNAQQLVAPAGHACREDSRAVLRRLGHLRAQLLRRRRASRRAAVAARREARSPAVHAVG